jgi:CubicO group peptidase (beta-lactamase class C family)
MSKVKLILALLLVSFSLQAQTVLNKDSANSMTDKIDSYLLSAVAANKFNGVALIAQKGEIIFHKAYGWKNFVAKTYNDTSTRFPILSITKSFTAMIILKLQEQNKLSLKDKLSKYLPDFPSGNKITIEQLITHTSGIYNYTDDIGEEDSAIVNHPVAQQRILDIFYNKPLSYEPGKGFGYNNSGYYLAGIIIEKATGKSYWQNVRELIFTPLGMDNSGFDFNNLPDNIKAIGYQFLNGNEQKPYSYVDSTVGYSAGAIYSTAGDLFKWTQAIANQTLLSSKSWKLAFTRKASDYGIGFRINHFFGRNYIKHSGGYPGFVSEFIYYPKEEVTIILFKNSGNYGQDVWPVTMGLSSIVFGLPYDMWKSRSELKLLNDLLEQKAGKYTADKLTIRFIVKDSQLHMILPNGTELPLFAESEDSFYLENFNTHLRFEKNAKGIFDKVILHEHGKDLELKKVE